MPGPCRGSSWIISRYPDTYCRDIIRILLSLFNGSTSAGNGDDPAGLGAFLPPGAPLDTPGTGSEILAVVAARAAQPIRTEPRRHGRCPHGCSADRLVCIWVQPRCSPTAHPPSRVRDYGGRAHHVPDGFSRQTVPLDPADRPQARLPAKQQTGQSALRPKAWRPSRLSLARHDWAVRATPRAPRQPARRGSGAGGNAAVSPAVRRHYGACHNHVHHLTVWALVQGRKGVSGTVNQVGETRRLGPIHGVSTGAKTTRIPQGPSQLSGPIPRREADWHDSPPLPYAPPRITRVTPDAGPLGSVTVPPG